MTQHRAGSCRNRTATRRQAMAYQTAPWVCWSLLACNLLLPIAIGCGDDPEPAEPCSHVARFDPGPAAAGQKSASKWLRYPFPADHRRRDDGMIDLSDFANPGSLDELRTYTSYGRYLDGFGTNSPIWLNFNTALRTADIPTLAGGFLEPDAVLQLIDISPSSPEYGQRRPLRWQFFSSEGRYVPANTLAVAPDWGFPLREATTYALLVTNGIHSSDNQKLGTPLLLSELLGAESTFACAGATASGELRNTLTRQFAPLRDLLAREQFDVQKIVAATVFTTQHITGELAAIYDHLYSSAIDPPVRQDDAWQELGEPDSGQLWREASGTYNAKGDQVSYYVLEGRYWSPNFQNGAVPYYTDGGEFNFVDGVLGRPHRENLRFVLTVPTDPPADNGRCYPIVEYSHGTTGDAYGFTEGSRPTSTAARLAARGLAGIGIDQPLHGLRWSRSDDEVAVAQFSFNVFNPDAARTLFRQSAVDTFWLTRFIREALAVPATVSPTGSDICFDPQRIGYFGHSQGGLTGAIAAAYESNINPWVLSGAGGGISITIIERQDQYIDAMAVMRTFLEPAEGEELTELHPVVGLLQLLLEITDPINYSPFWLHQSEHSSPKSIMVTSGEHDTATPWRTATAMALAGRVPILRPAPLPIPGYLAAGLLPQDAPVQANLSGETAGFLQWTDDLRIPDADSHFVIFRRPEAINASMRFLQSAAYDGAAVIERDPGSDAR